MTSKQYGFIKRMCCYIEEIFPCLPSDIILFIACQSALESSYGTSDLCRLYHNFFGMRNPLIRPSTSQVWGMPEYEFAHYDYWYSSLVDYFLCISYRRPIRSQLDSVEHFSAFIKNWYCPEKDYIDKIIKLMSNFKSYKNGNE